MILFELLVGNNWHSIMDGFTAATGNLTVRIYFIVFTIVSEVRQWFYLCIGPFNH